MPNSPVQAAAEGSPVENSRHRLLRTIAGIAGIVRRAHSRGVNSSRLDEARPTEAGTSAKRDAFMNQHVNRRALVAVAATVASIGPAVADAGEHPGAKLIQIGDELTEVVAALYLACKASTAARVAEEDYEALWEAASDLSVKASDMVERALALTPQSPEGLAVWAQAAALDTPTADIHAPQQIVRAVESEPLNSGFAAVIRRMVLSATAATLATPAAALAAFEAPALVTPALAKLLQEHDTAAQAYRQRSDEYEAFRAKARPDQFGRCVLERDNEITATFEAECSDLQMECYPHFDAVLAFPCMTLVDVRAKVAVLTSSPAGADDYSFEPEEMRAFLTSLMGEARP